MHTAFPRNYILSIIPSGGYGQSCHPGVCLPARSWDSLSQYRTGPLRSGGFTPPSLPPRHCLCPPTRSPPRSSLVPHPSSPLPSPSSLPPRHSSLITASALPPRSPLVPHPSSLITASAPPPACPLAIGAPLRDGSALCASRLLCRESRPGRDCLNHRHVCRRVSRRAHSRLATVPFQPARRPPTNSRSQAGMGSACAAKQTIKGWKCWLTLVNPRRYNWRTKGEH